MMNKPHFGRPEEKRWQVLARETLAGTPYFSLVKSRVRMPDAGETTYYTIDFPRAAVGVVPDAIGVRLDDLELEGGGSAVQDQDVHLPADCTRGTIVASTASPLTRSSATVTGKSKRRGPQLPGLT